MVGLDFLAGGGECGALMRAHDWSGSSLGHPASWPQSLRSVVGLLLQSRFPMFVAWGPELGFLYNDSYAAILGEKHPRALGRRFRDIWAEIWADISPLIDGAMAGEASYREDLPLVMNRRGYDEQTWFTFSYSPVRDETGKVAGMFCAVAETTTTVLAQRALRDSESRLRELNETLERRISAGLAERKILADIVEGTDAFVQVVDLDFRWLAINRAAAAEFERIFGKRPEVGGSMLALLADQPEHRAAVENVWRRALDGEEFTLTAEFGDPKRDRRAYEMKFNSLRDEGGRRIGAYQFVYDVTERLRDQERLRRAEEALLQAQKLEAIGQLTGGIAHDFNNLLAIVSAGLEVIARQADPASRTRVLEGMRRAVDRGTALTRHLLAFSRRRPVNPEAIDLASHFAGMREMLSRSLRGDIRVAMAFQPDLWPVEVDIGEIELAIVNLCVNARDAMPEGGTITIGAENVRNPEEGILDGDFVKVTVSDTGTGIPPSAIPRVFEPFFTTKEVGKGSGLGLAQVYGFAQQSGGRARIESEVGVGTTVILLLPRCHRRPDPAHAKMPAADAMPDLAHASPHVLLVEDDDEVAALVIEMLHSLGYEVTRVASAAAALGAIADERVVDVVLSDVMMPGGMSGRELARELRRRRPTLPVVLTTGYAESAQGLEREGYVVLLKPYRLEALARMLTSQLSGRLKTRAGGAT